MKKFFVFLIAAILCISLCACTQEEMNFRSNAGLTEIANRDNLYYDANTKIVYIVYREKSGYGGYGFMSAYYSSNGLPYCYDANSQTLIEIDGR